MNHQTCAVLGSLHRVKFFNLLVAMIMSVPVTRMARLRLKIGKKAQGIATRALSSTNLNTTPLLLHEKRNDQTTNIQFRYLHNANDEPTRRNPLPTLQLVGTLNRIDWCGSVNDWLKCLLNRNETQIHWIDEINGILNEHFQFLDQFCFLPGAR